MQSITPIEIRQKSFAKSFRGYHPDEVSAFLHALSYAWEKLTARLDEVTSTLEDSNTAVRRLQGVEHALLKTIKDAEVTAHHITEQAKKEAELKARETKLETEKMIHEAQEKIKAIEEDNRRKHQYLMEQMERELKRTKKMVQGAETYRDTLLQKLQHLAEDILTRSQLIERNIQRNVGNEDALKGEEFDTDTTLSSDSDLEVAVAV
jgi:cell division initiation protein